jgi:organic radical activating enzyme
MNIKAVKKEVDRFEKYTNGNYDVMISPITGTKIRDNHRDDDLFDAEFPECADICITSYCDRGCPFCYVSSGEDGRDAPFEEMKPYLETFRPWTEVALGGGSPILHKQLPAILDLFKTRNVLPSITVHWAHFKEKFPMLKDLVENRLLYGVGVSASSYRDDIVELIKKNDFKNAVVHTIAGITTVEDMKKYVEAGVKILVLGYKNMGRGEHHGEEFEAIRKNIDDLRVWLEEAVKNNRFTNIISFDNLALKQLDVRKTIGEERWNSCYMGDDGVDGKLTSASMYIDFVNKTFSRNSVNAVKHDIGDVVDVKDMFQILKKGE